MYGQFLNSGAVMQDRVRRRSQRNPKGGCCRKSTPYPHARINVSLLDSGIVWLAFSGLAILFSIFEVYFGNHDSEKLFGAAFTEPHCEVDYLELNAPALVVGALWPKNGRD